MSRQRIAIIGSGISGLTVAHLLHEDFDITVFEANDYIGGHTHTVPVEMGGQTLQVDTGFIVCNDRNYPHFLKFMQKLGVTMQETEMSFSVHNPRLGLEYNGHNLNTLFAQRRNLLRPRFIGLVRDILRFNKAAKAAAQKQDLQDETLGSFAATLQVGPWFMDNYLLPMVAAIWSCSLKQAQEFPLTFFLKFFLNHGLLDIRNRPQWYVLKGGSHAYIEPMTRGFADRIRLSCPVQRVERADAGIKIYSPRGEEMFDQVVMACHSDQSLQMLAHPRADEQQILGAMAYQDNDVILHHDASIMPRRAHCWASWNFLAGDSDRQTAPKVTYSMNRLQGLVSAEPLLVSLNAREHIDPAKIIQQFNYAHPVYSLASMAAQQQRAEICGVDRIHYCGAYWYNGFHEDGVRSALDVAARFGKTL